MHISPTGVRRYPTFPSDTFRRRVQGRGPETPEPGPGQIDVLRSESPGPELLGQPRNLDPQLELFAERGPGNNARRATLTDPEGRTLIARAVAGIRGAARC